MNPAYLKGLSGKERQKRKKEIESRAKLDSDDPTAYRPFKTDKTSKGETRKTKTSKWTKKAAKMGYGPKSKRKRKSYGPKKEGEEKLEMVDEVMEEAIRELVREVILEEELRSLEEKKDSVTKALKNKAEKSGAPMSALRAIYNKGLAAWRTGHRPGASQHAWAMARVNSVLAGGPARKIDATQWKQIQKARKKKK